MPSWKGGGGQGAVLVAVSEQDLMTVQDMRNLRENSGACILPIRNISRRLLLPGALYCA